MSFVCLVSDDGMQSGSLDETHVTQALTEPESRAGLGKLFDTWATMGSKM